MATRVVPGTDGVGLGVGVGSVVPDPDERVIWTVVPRRTFRVVPSGSLYVGEVFRTLPLSMEALATFR
jgi:hypothetical protein